MNINPTQGSSAVVHTSGGKSAELKSQFKVKFAAASCIPDLLVGWLV